jgi:hypothetical protein
MSEALTLSIGWIIGAVFAAVGLYLVWYSQRRKKMLTTFAAKHSFAIDGNRTAKLEHSLAQCLRVGIPGIVREFGQLSTPVDAGSVQIFRAVELIDLSPNTQPDSTHFSRIAALFDIAQEYDEYFLLRKSREVANLHPFHESLDTNAVQVAADIALSCEARHTLSVTLRRGKGLAYFEPTLTGGENKADIDALYCIAKGMKDAYAIRD